MFFGGVRVFSDAEAAYKYAWVEDGDSEFDLPLWEVEVDGGEKFDKAEVAAPGGTGRVTLSDVWLCGLWYKEDTACIGLLLRAFLTPRAARAAARGFCPPAALGLNAADCCGLREEGLVDPDFIRLQVVRVSAQGQPPGQLTGAAMQAEYR